MRTGDKPGGTSQQPPGPALTRPGSGTDRAGRLALARTLLVSVVAPWVVFVLLRPHVRSDAEALAIGGAIPAAWILLRLALTRRVDWIAVASVTVFAVTLVVSLLSGGSALPLKLRYSVTTGAMGLACVISVVVRQPLPVLLARLPALHDPERARRIQQVLDDPRRRHRLTVLTVVFGLVLVIDATVRAVLAISLPTTDYLAVSGVVSWIIVGTGLLLLWLYLRLSRRHDGTVPSGALPAGRGPAGNAPRAHRG